MIYLKEYTNQSDINKYILIKNEYIQDVYHICKNLETQWLKIYDIFDNKLIKIEQNFYLTMSSNRYKLIIYQSNHLDDILNNLETILDSNKYNI
jgi:hypothetical protein